MRERYYFDFLAIIPAAARDQINTALGKLECGPNTFTIKAALVSAPTVLHSYIAGFPVSPFGFAIIKSIATNKESEIAVWPRDAPGDDGEPKYRNVPGQAKKKLRNVFDLPEYKGGNPATRPYGRVTILPKPITIRKWLQRNNMVRMP